VVMDFRKLIVLIFDSFFAPRTIVRKQAIGMIKTIALDPAQLKHMSVQTGYILSPLKNNRT